MISWGSPLPLWSSLKIVLKTTMSEVEASSEENWLFVFQSGLTFFFFFCSSSIAWIWETLPHLGTALSVAFHFTKYLWFVCSSSCFVMNILIFRILLYVRFEVPCTGFAMLLWIIYFISCKANPFAYLYFYVSMFCISDFSVWFTSITSYVWCGRCNTTSYS